MELPTLANTITAGDLLICFFLYCILRALPNSRYVDNASVHVEKINEQMIELRGDVYKLDRSVSEELKFLGSELDQIKWNTTPKKYD
jgi:hypothetical protein